VRRSDLIRALARVPPFPSPDPAAEQVATPPEAAADLLLEAVARGDLVGRNLLDLGAGTGTLAIGAALLGARSVVAVEADPAALAAGRAADPAGPTPIEWVHADVREFARAADTVVMNPPFGAQRRHADRPFWDRALALARRAVYAFALADSRTFIAGEAVARGARIEETRPVAWRLPRTFAHHRARSVELPVDLWVLRRGNGR
jgi:putative methylase